MNRVLQSRYCLRGQLPGTRQFKSTTLTQHECQAEKLRTGQASGNIYLTYHQVRFDTRSFCWGWACTNWSSYASITKMLDSIGITHFWSASMDSIQCQAINSTLQSLVLLGEQLLWTRQFTLITTHLVQMPSRSPENQGWDKPTVLIGYNQLPTKPIYDTRLFYHREPCRNQDWYTAISKNA